MILPLELIIYLDQYSTNRYILLLNKLINTEIKQSNNSQYWKNKYLEKTRELGISTMALNINDDNMIPKYEYARLINQAIIINNIRIFPPRGVLFRRKKQIDDVINLFKQKKDNNIKIKFMLPYCSFDIKKFKIPKEFKFLDLSNLDINEIEKNHCYEMCWECYNNAIHKKIMSWL